MREICTSGSVGALGEKSSGATRPRHKLSITFRSFCRNTTQTPPRLLTATWSRSATSAMPRPVGLARAHGHTGRPGADAAVRDRDLYSIDEARERLGGISRNSIYQLLHRGQLASVIIGTRRLVSAAAIDQLIANATTTTSPTVTAARVPLRSKRKLALAASPLLIHNRRSDDRR